MSAPRVKTGLAAGAVFLAVLTWGGSWGFAVLVAAAAAVGVDEYLRIAAGVRPPLETWFTAGWGGVVALSFLGPSAGMPAAALGVGALVYLGGWVLGPGPRPEALARWGATAGAWVLVAYFLGCAVWVREHGIAPVLFACAVVWAGDTAAYYVGRAFGSTPLAPAVSPKKTVEGAAASVVAAVAVAGLLGALAPLPHGPAASLALGAALNVAAQVGDLAESLLKRCAGVKDSGTLFPGHGGLLDRADAFLFVLPLYAAFLSLGG